MVWEELLNPDVENAHHNFSLHFTDEEMKS